jgi:hypothetical protein
MHDQLEQSVRPDCVRLARQIGRDKWSLEEETSAHILTEEHTWMSWMFDVLRQAWVLVS